MMNVSDDQYGFYWDGIAVQRTAALSRGKQGTWHVLSITTQRANQKIDVYVSPSGFVRVFKGNHPTELIPKKLTG